MPVSKKIRFEVFKRDGFKCQYCGRTPPDTVLEIDHIIPKSKKGTDDESNLLTACFDCNRGKGSNSLESLPKKSVFNIDSLKEKTLQLKELKKYQIKLIEYEKYQIDTLENYWGYCFTDDQKKVVLKFISALSFSAVKDAIIWASHRLTYKSPYSQFKYFCGICWNKIKEKNNAKQSN